MKTIRALTLALGLFALPALSGDCLTGTDCVNHCPLAKKANERMATGNEALAVSQTIRSDVVATVLRNCEGI